MSINKYILIIISLIVSNFVSAQTFRVDAKIDSTVIYIGQQCNITFDISQNLDMKVTAPIFSDTITKGIEIVDFSTDTIKNSDGYITVRNNYLITAFDSALYHIPEFPFVSNGDTVWSYSLSLKVLTVPIDTTSQEIVIADIKPIVEPPFDWGEWKAIIIIGLLSIIVIILAILLIHNYLQNKKRKNEVVEELPEIVKTCDEIALEQLDVIRRDKIWQAGRVKEYYTDITDVLRTYIESRFAIVAFERTSSEIIDALDFVKRDYPQPLTLLSRIFNTSDMVKFAKLIPDFNTHTDILNDATEFVNATKESESLHTIDKQTVKTK